MGYGHNSTLQQLGTLDGLLTWHEDLVPRTGGGYRRVRSAGCLNGVPLSYEELVARIEHARSHTAEPFWF